ncbi:MAG TPA: tetratricopeptide repeat protein [Thermoanaerobaculia bacterium]|jgi:tetratricopeptide (TPR) repeat protein
MKTRFHVLPILPLLAGLALTSVASSARAADAILQEEAARAYQRAERLVQEKQYRKAAIEFERASELAGGDCPECLLGVARAYSGAGQIEAALQVTRMALSLLSAPEHRAQAYNQLGSLLVLKGDMDAAREAFQKAVELDAGVEPQVRSSLAEALLKRASSAKPASNSAPEEVEITANAGSGSGGRAP